MFKQLASEKGNPGRPKGARHKVTQAVEALLDGEAEELTRKAVELAKGGDITALRLCLDRIFPSRKGASVSFSLSGGLDTPQGVSETLSGILKAVSDGDLTPDEAATVSNIIETKRRAIETVEIEERLTALEKAR